MATASALHDIRGHLAGCFSGGGGDSQEGSPDIRHRRHAMSLPLGLVAVVLEGGLPFALRLLLQNDSLTDISARSELYNAALMLLR